MTLTVTGSSCNLWLYRKYIDSYTTQSLKCKAQSAFRLEAMQLPRRCQALSQSLLYRSTCRFTSSESVANPQDENSRQQCRLGQYGTLTGPARGWKILLQACRRQIVADQRTHRYIVKRLSRPSSARRGSTGHTRTLHWYSGSIVRCVFETTAIPYNRRVIAM